jgi:hypothetical protein
MWLGADFATKVTLRKCSHSNLFRSSQHITILEKRHGGFLQLEVARQSDSIAEVRKINGKVDRS